MNIKEKCSPGRPRRVENEGLEPSGALPGAMWAQGGRQEGSKWLLGAARGGVPGGSPEGSGGAPGWYFWSFFGHAARGTKKQCKMSKKTLFFLLVECLFFIHFLVLFGFLVAAPEWTLKNITIS